MWRSMTGESGDWKCAVGWVLLQSDLLSCSGQSPKILFDSTSGTGGGRCAKTTSALACVGSETAVVSTPATAVRRDTMVYAGFISAISTPAVDQHGKAWRLGLLFGMGHSALFRCARRTATARGFRHPCCREKGHTQTQGCCSEGVNRSTTKSQSSRL